MTLGQKMLKLKLQIIITVLYLGISIITPKITFVAIVFIKYNLEYKNLMFSFCELKCKVYNINAFLQKLIFII